MKFLLDYLVELLSRSSLCVLEEGAYDADDEWEQEEECPDSPDPYRRKEEYIEHLKSELERMKSIYKET